jgi:hypothetical protein
MAHWSLGRVRAHLSLISVELFGRGRVQMEAFNNPHQQSAVCPLSRETLVGGRRFVWNRSPIMFRG